MKSLRYSALFCFLTLVCLSSRAADFKLHNADVAVGGTGQFTTSITSQDNVPHQATTNSTGFLLSFRDRPVSWAGVELNYQYSAFSERFVRLNQTRVSVPQSFDEASALYLVHAHVFGISPFVGVGGGALYFNPSPVHVRTQLRGTGLTTIGLDLPVPNSRMGFRVQARALLYRAPNYNDPTIATSRWVATSEPAASVYIRF